MARPREFDVDQVLDRTMRAFWTQGYGATSLDDLLKAANLKKQSLYSAFGNKHSLFLKALVLYGVQTLKQVREMVDRADSPLSGIEAVMRYATRSPASRNCPSGCLMANTALEMGWKDPEVNREVTRMFRGFERILNGAIKKGQERGEIATRFRSNALARSLTNTLNGIRILEKTGASRSQMKAVVDVALKGLRP